MMGQVATFMESLHLSYTEVFEVIPYRQLIIMAKDKQHTAFYGLRHEMTGEEMAAKFGITIQTE